MLLSVVNRVCIQRKTSNGCFVSLYRATFTHGYASFVCFMCDNVINSFSIKFILRSVTSCANFIVVSVALDLFTYSHKENSYDYVQIVHKIMNGFSDLRSCTYIILGESLKQQLVIYCWTDSGCGRGPSNIQIQLLSRTPFLPIQTNVFLWVQLRF